MDPGGLDGNEGVDPFDPYDDFDSDPLIPPESPPTDGPRVWTHPSEAGMAARVHTDRRRGLALVIGLMALGAGVLLGTAVMTTAFSRKDDSAKASAAPTTDPLETCLALVEVHSGDSSSHLNGLLVDNGHHVVVSEADLDGADFTSAERLTVRIHGSRTTATVVARDPFADLALLRLNSPAGSEPEMSPAPAAGDSLRAVRFDSGGQRRSTMVRVDGVGTTWVRPGRSATDDVMTLSGDIVKAGVLVDPSGAVAGLVIGTDDGRSVAYSSSVLSTLVEQLRTGGTTGHPWIGVRAADISATPTGVTTSTAAPQVVRPAKGAIVTEVISDSPAEAAGLAPGDVIVAVEGAPVETMTDLVDMIGTLSPGDVVRVDLVRSGFPVQSMVRVEAFPG